MIKLPDSVHIYADPFPPGGSRYQMFFECTIGSKNSNTNVCTAVSQDAANWYIWGFAPGDPPEKRSWLPWQVGVVVPIILATLPDGVTPLPACDLLDPQQSNQCSYGVGYPSAVVMGGEVWIYYYSQTDGPVATSGTGYIARARTTDGVHLTAPEKTSIFAHNLQDPRIYVLDTYRGQFFMATAGQLGGDSPYYNPALPEKGNYFALSTDGLTFESIFRSQT